MLWNRAERNIGQDGEYLMRNQETRRSGEDCVNVKGRCISPPVKHWAMDLEERVNIECNVEDNKK